MNIEELTNLLKSKPRIFNEDLPEDLQLTSRVVAKYSAEYAIKLKIQELKIAELEQIATTLATRMDFDEEHIKAKVKIKHLIKKYYEDL